METIDDIIKYLKTPEQCLQLALIVQDRNPGLANKAHQRAIEIRIAAENHMSSVEAELRKVLFAYEEILSLKNKRRTRANRTWQMINRHGIIGAAERAVNRKTDASGYKVLVEKGLSKLTFEYVITCFPESFSKEAIIRAKARLEENNKLSLG
jgi:hypothetical protein